MYYTDCCERCLMNMLLICVYRGYKHDWIILVVLWQPLYVIAKWDSQWAIWHCNECFFYSNQLMFTINLLTDALTTMLWPSSEYTLSKTLRLRI